MLQQCFSNVSTFEEIPGTRGTTLPEPQSVSAGLGAMAWLNVGQHYIPYRDGGSKRLNLTYLTNWRRLLYYYTIVSLTDLLQFYSTYILRNFTFGIPRLYLQKNALSRINISNKLETNPRIRTWFMYSVHLATFYKEFFR